MGSHRLGSYGIALLGLTALSAPRRAAAQLAPTGDHYGARQSDTGFESGGPTALGAYSTSIPLALPPARGNLPIPLSVVYGAQGSSAAGIGWDIPLSYVQDDSSFNHRRPALVEDGVPRARERLSVVLPGRGRVEMILKSTNVWMGRADGADLTMKPALDGSWIVSDGAGRTYTFKTQVPQSGVFLLDSVTGAGGGAIALRYQITAVALDGSTPTATSIDLLSVRYDPHPTTADCYKYEVDLSYDAAPLTLKVVGQAVLARLDKLLKVDVTSRSSCTATPVSLRHYGLSYQPDLDTGLFQLQSVKLYGRQGTTEASTALPIATYSYGTATAANGSSRVLFYQATPAVTLPVSAPDIGGDAGLSPLVLPLPNSSNVSATLQSLTDLTGDGRADFIYMGSNNQPYIARNVPGPNGTSLLGPGTPLLNGPLTKGYLEERGSKYARFKTPQTNGSFNVDYVWRQAIDFNGDGRIDIVDASEEPGRWAVYLNTPDSTGQGIKWVRRSVRVDALYKHMSVERSLDLQNGYLPLSRRFTATAYQEFVCWLKLDSGEIREDPDPNFDDGNCPPPDPTWTLAKLPESTFVEWELKDVNGDGYPDMVMNSSPTQLVPSPPPSSINGWYEIGRRTWTPAPIGQFNPNTPTVRDTNRVDVALNVRGIFLSNEPTDFNPFAAPVPLVPRAYCGVSSWNDAIGTQYDVQNLGCDITDVNGDGIADRVDTVYATDSSGTHNNTVVSLGTGSGFLPTQLTLPDHLWLSSQRSTQPEVCNAPGHTDSTLFTSGTTTALRDLTGDGIPDLVNFDVANYRWVVYVGTGGGFGAAIPIQNSAFVLSENTENCGGTLSYTRAGLFDIDGDGKPEIVSINGNTLSVAQVDGNGTPGTPEGGRLVSVDNGYGAITGITYRSAKEEPHLLHQVPFPEIVATNVQTIATTDGRTLSDSRFAYGGAVMMYDQALDTYRLPAYSRTVELHAVIDAADRPNAQATISDTYPLAPFDSTAGEDERFGRYLRAGRVSDRTVLAVIGASDPWPLLDVNIYGDTRRIAGAHYTYLGRAFNQPDPTVVQSEDADDVYYDVIDPLDFDASAQGLNSGSFDPLSAHGFLFTQMVDSWRGTPPPSSNGIEARVSVLTVDEFARPTSVLYSNDVHRSDDDFCVDTTFATPTGSGAPVLNAQSSSKVWDCSKGSTNAVYGYESYEYDKLPLGSVAQGHTTGHNVERHATDSGGILASFRDFDVTYDAGGNPSQLIRTREDGSKRTTTFVYDAFDIAPARVVVAGTGTPTLNAYYALDPYSLDVTETRDANNAMRGTRFDGFGRPTMTTFRVAGGTQMALSSVSYLGFTDNSGRRVVVKQFTDPVATTAVASAVGRTSTTLLDELGRKRVTQVALGADYANETLLVGARTYDSLGRVVFEADPYPASQDPSSAYGTTRYFNVDGSPYVFLRGRGPQPLTTTPDPSVERFPTLYRHSFAGNQESLSVQQSDSLTNPSPQNGVLRTQISSAIGRVLFRSTWQNGARLEHEQLNSDRVGHAVALIRFADPVGATLPVQTLTSYDSSGNLVQMQEPGGALQKRSFSNFGELKEVDFIPSGTEPMHSLIRKFDTLGRLVHAEEQNGGVTDADTVYSYGYDTAKSPTTSVTPTNVLGRLTAATAPTGGHYFSYDSYGDVDARVFTDENAAYYIERQRFHGDGSRASLELDLPDNAYTAERVDYGYDSAGRLRSMLYSDGTSTQSLYTATTIDPFGRVRKAAFGETSYGADYADTGRRLFADVTVSSPLGLRSIVVNGYDAVGRELSRTQQGKTNGTQASTYDALGRLATSVTTNGSLTLANWSYGYDALGNINGLNDYVGSKDAAISYGTTDRDQICRINYNAFGTACNVTHDSFGNVVSEGTRTGGRKIAYYNGGAARRIDDSAGSSVTMKYDPFGREQELDLASGGETRSDRNYGAHIYHRYQLKGLLKSNYVGRQFPGPGVRISRRGVGGPWVVSFEETRGVRFSTDQNGTFVQDVDYQPFGEATASGAPAGDPTYSPEQWNGGNALGAVGLVQVGARLYDPVIGRFLSRDPLFAPRTAATTNPYAFAFNDPVGHSDPTGFDPPETQDPGSPVFSLTDAFNSAGVGPLQNPAPPAPKLPHQVLAHSALSPASMPSPSEPKEGEEGEENPLENPLVKDLSAFFAGPGWLETGKWVEALNNQTQLIMTAEKAEEQLAERVMEGRGFWNGAGGFFEATELANASYEVVTKGGFTAGLKWDEAFLKFWLSKELGGTGSLINWTYDHGKAVTDAVFFNPVSWAEIQEYMGDDELEKFGRQQQELMGANHYHGFMQRLRGDLNDLANAQLYGPTCTGEGQAFVLRNEGHALDNEQ